MCWAADVTNHPETSRKDEVGLRKVLVSETLPPPLKQLYLLIAGRVSSYKDKNEMFYGGSSARTSTLLTCCKRVAAWTRELSIVLPQALDRPHTPSRCLFLSAPPDDTHTHTLKLSQMKTVSVGNSLILFVLMDLEMFHLWWTLLDIEPVGCHVVGFMTEAVQVHIQVQLTSVQPSLDLQSLHFLLSVLFLFLFFIIVTSFLILTFSYITSGKPKLRPAVGNSSSAVDPVTLCGQRPGHCPQQHKSTHYCKERW